MPNHESAHTPGPVTPGDPPPQPPGQPAPQPQPGPPPGDPLPTQAALEQGDPGRVVDALLRDAFAREEVP